MKQRFIIAVISALMLMPFSAWGRDFKVSFSNADAESAIIQLQKETGYDFVYQKDVIKSVKKHVSGSFSSTSLEQLLNDVVSGRLGLDYEIVDNAVILRVADKKQQKTVAPRVIKGTVYDETGEPLAGAFVQIEGTEIGAGTDADGNFSLNVNVANPVVKVAYIGMKPVAVAVTASTKMPMRITMDTNYAVMDEVVVTGYQNIKRENATGAYQTITEKDMERRYTGSVAENLEGKIPGLVTNSRESGEDAIVIRGVGTLNAATKPLVVVDGLPIEGGIETVNPYDISNITVLKDAAAASIYGARASNGVIVITTKRATSDKVSIDFNTDITVSEKRNYSNYGWASAAEIIELEKYNFDYIKNRQDGLALKSLVSEYNSRKQNMQIVMRDMIANHLGDLSDSELQSNLNRYASNDYRREWQDAFERSRVLQQYNLAVRVQGRSLSSSIVLNYKTDNLGNQGENNDALTFKYRGDLKVAKWLDLAFGANVISERGKTHLERPSITEYSPIRSFYNSDGTLGDFNLGIYDTLEAMQHPEYGLKSMWYNPVDEKDLGLNKIRRTNIRTYLQATGKILPGWTVTGNFQYEDIYYKSDAYREAELYRMRELYNLYTEKKVEMVEDIDWETWETIYVPMEKIIHNLPEGGRLDQTTSEGAYYTFRAQTQYNQTFKDKHYVDVVAGFEYRDMHDKTSRNLYLGYDDQTQQNSNAFVNFKDLVDKQGQASILGSTYNMYGAPSASDFTTTDILHRFYSIYFTGNYVYDNRYAISGSWRIDKTDLFGADPKFRGRPLWSIGGSWNAHNEAFLRDQIWISALKPRVSYGLTGNIDSSVSSFLVASIVQNDYNGYNMATLDTPPNDQLRWEKTATWNFGVDFAFWNYRLSGSFDYYHKKGTDLLATTDLDPTSGWNSLTINNASAINKGVELQLNGHIIQQTHRNSLGINAYANFAYNNNKIVKVHHKAATGYENLNYYTFHEGYPVNSLFSYDFAGLKVGDNGIQYFTWRDANGEVHDSEITTDEFKPEDVVYSGVRDPKYVASLTPEITYGGFTLSAMMSYYGGHVMRVNTDDWDAYGSSKGYEIFVSGPVPSAALNYWRSGDATLYPANGYAGESTVGKYCASYMNTNVVPADYLKLRNIVLSYEFDPRLTRKIGIQQARLRFQMNNVATWVRNKEGKDPEAVNSFSGANYTRVPRSYTFSLFLNF